MTDIENRKNDHIDFVMKNEKNRHSYFDDYRLEHNALPEINFADVDTHVKFLGRKLKLPLLISSISGGIKRAEKINRNLAEIAQDFGLGFCLGSQRIALDDPSKAESFKVRKYASDILLLANFGAIQFNYGYGVEECIRAVDMADADGLILHLNPLQEVFQNNGTTNFENLLPHIEKVCKKLPVPVIVKEVGSGISYSVAKRLFNAGVNTVDVAGLGSISWPEIEGARLHDIVYKSATNLFDDWGVPTLECVAEISTQLPEMSVIASGGLRNGVDIAKSIACGASICGMASSILREFLDSRSECEVFLETLSLELKVAMFCTGSKNIDMLKKAKITRIEK